jgi:hypothetical protein
MRFFPKKILCMALLLLGPATTFADLKVIVAKESDLPFELSSSKFSNSPSKFSNSVSKFSNSPSKFSNSSSKFENSPSKFENGMGGNRRLLLEQDRTYFYVGYYVFGDDGLMNFYSPDGARVFYSPADTGAVFGGDSGTFCGTLAVLDQEQVLVLTENGQLALLKNGISLSNRGSSSPRYPAGEPSDASSSHWIQENIDAGSMIVLEDGSIWKIDPLDKLVAMLWLPVSTITIVRSQNGSPGYDYLLINTDDGEMAHAKFLGHK